MIDDKEFLRSLTRIAAAIKEVSDNETTNNFFFNRKITVTVNTDRESVDWINNFMSMFTHDDNVTDNPDKVEVRIGDTTFEFTC